jgi:uncharacterized protein YdeI (YjbR/CyaY-like superfamily)
VTNHEKASKVFLISWKRHTGKSFLSHREQMDEAICWGWIDTTVKRIDDDRYGRYFVKRGPNARWSTNTISYAEKLIAAGRMQASGMRAYEHGLKHTVADSQAGKKASMPAVLRDALAENKTAQANFKQYPPSIQKRFFSWIGSAKREETVRKRVRETLLLAEKNKRPF